MQGIPALFIPRFEKGGGGVANHLPDAQPVEALPGRSVPASGLTEAPEAKTRRENESFGPARRQKSLLFIVNSTLCSTAFPGSLLRRRLAHAGRFHSDRLLRESPCGTGWRIPRDPRSPAPGSPLRPRPSFES